MGCNASVNNSSFSSDTRGAKGVESVVVKQAHVSSTGNVDLSLHRLSSLDGSILNGVRHDKLNRTAISLQLNNNQLRGIGKEILLLPTLEKIDLESNLLSRVPEILTRLEMLSHLNLSCNTIEEKHFAPLARLQCLKSLALRNCSLTTIPIAVLRCEFLEELDISSNPGIKLDGVPPWKSGCLKTIALSNCALEGEQLPPVISNLKEVVHLDISGNKFRCDNMNFFGPNISRTLKILHLRDMNLEFVPHGVVTLCQLNSLDLGGNPITDLDVLAGRITMRTTTAFSPMSASGALSLAPSIAVETLDNLEMAESGSVFSGQPSLTNVSKIVGLSTIPQPMNLKRLCLRSCKLKHVPKYFHKLSNLEELDISYNEELDDPAMTLFSLEKLRVLNIVQCPFALDISKSKNEWYDISKLRNLRQLDWSLWKEMQNVSAYNTRIPIEITSLELEVINGLKLERGIFVGDALPTIVNLLKNGYFKIDLAIDEATVHSYIDALNVLKEGRPFFFPSDDSFQEAQFGTMDTSSQPADAPKAEAPSSSLSMEGLLENILVARLRIAISRYVFFLTVQAANYDATMVPPLDVMILHYAFLVTNPSTYRKDCEAICGRILDCNYRHFFLDCGNLPEVKKDLVRTGELVWNKMAQQLQHNFSWLSYGFWDQRAQISNSLSPSSSTSVLIYGLPCSPFPSREAAEKELAELNEFKAFEDLFSILDPAIMAHFSEKGIEIYKEAIRNFFSISNAFFQVDTKIRTMFLDWSRYVKFFCLCSLYNNKICEKKNIVVENLASVTTFQVTPPRKKVSMIGARYDALEEQEAARGVSRRPSINPSRSNKQLMKCVTDILKYNPVPTIGVLYLLHAHRTAPVKYFQILSLFGLEANDITWVNSKLCTDNTAEAWHKLFEEVYYVRQNEMFLWDINDLPSVECLEMQEESTTLIFWSSSVTHVDHKRLPGQLKKNVSFFLGGDIY